MKNGNGAYFPMFVDLNGKEGLVIGGGRTAFGKIQRLLPWGPAVTVIAPEFCPKLLELCGNEEPAEGYRPALICREFSPDDITDDLAFVIAASDRPEVNRHAAAVCRKKRIPVNVVDVPEECSFFFPSLIRRGPLTIGISTGGASPSAAIHFRKEIGQILPDNIGAILEWLSERRGAVKEAIGQEELRREAYKRLFEKCLEEGRPLTEQEEKEILLH